MKMLLGVFGEPALWEGAEEETHSSRGMLIGGKATPVQPAEVAGGGLPVLCCLHPRLLQGWVVSGGCSCHGGKGCRRGDFGGGY